MSRKDTILIAVLLNAGLLIVMFVLAIKPSHVKESFVKKKPENTIAIEPALITKKEIDKILTTYNTEVPSSSHTLRPTASEPEVTVQEKKTPLHLTENKPLLPTSTISITVQSGDALEKIAKTHNTTVKEIMKFNNLVNTKLQIGQTIYLPPVSKESVKSEPTPSLAVAKQQFYTVRTGDTPWTIAAKNQLKVDELLELNNLNQEKARYLKPGDRLRIR